MSSCSKLGRLLDVLVERRDPAAVGVDGDLEVAQRGDVVGAGLAGELLADLVADVVLGRTV
jgi:hypothetical protein